MPRTDARRTRPPRVAHLTLRPLTWDARFEKQQWAFRVGLVSLGCALLGLFSPNPTITAVGFLVIPVLFLLLWNTGEPPVLLFAAVFQWSQVFVPVLLANARGEVLSQRVAPRDIGLMDLPELTMAAWLGLATIVVLACGMRVGRGGRSLVSPQELRAASAAVSPSRLMAAYFLTFAPSLLGAGVASVLPGLRQAWLAFDLLHWIVVFLVLWAALNQPRFRRGAVIVLACEVILGFSGYFGSFKTILFLALIAALGNETKAVHLLRPRFMMLVVAGFLVGAYWQAIKVDYRAFLNQGTRAQVVLVTPAERAEFLIDKTLSLRLDDFVAAAESGLERLGYLDFFAMTLAQVPEHVPYQNGRLWREAVAHVLMPRLFFPAKPAIDDSARTNEFSGVFVTEGEGGTSISLGYAAESYIDFGPVLMFVPIGLLGVLWGVCYRWLASLSSARLLGLAGATALILMSAILFESSNIKLLGGALTNAAVLSLLLAYGGQRAWRWLGGD